MGPEAASNRYPPDIQHSRHTESFFSKDRQVVQLVSACNLPIYEVQVRSGEVLARLVIVPAPSFFVMRRGDLLVSSEEA